MKKRVAVVGAGLCGSVISTLLRNDFKVTVVEQGTKKRPLFDDIDCSTGEVNTSINRAQGLGGTTNYWHNALFELDDVDLAKAGIQTRAFEPYYAKAWSFFLSPEELAECDRARSANLQGIAGRQCTLGHMVLPQSRHNAWHLAAQRNPGDDIDVVHGHVEKIVAPAQGAGGAGGHVELAGGGRVDADYVILSAGGLSTPVLLARSFGNESAFCAGYHDHPMAYVAKVKLKPDSKLKALSCTTTQTSEVRAGLIYTSEDRKTVVFLRPAIDMKLSSITGAARYILSDLRNDPFSPKKIMLLLGNLEAVREAILFKTRSGFRGDYFSVLILGEQTPLPTRGVKLEKGKRPTLNWHVTPEERASYEASVQKFFGEFADDLLETNVIPAAKWDFRNAAHHSGTAGPFLASPADTGLDFFSVKDLPGSFVYDGSLLRAAGVANTGLTLVALGYELADRMRALA
jgi:hypothetical protein